MKKGKSFVSLFAMAAALLLAFQVSLTASAAGNTYIVHSDDGTEEWWYQSGSAWDETEESKELYYLQQIIQNGDLLVVQGRGGEIKVNVHLNNLTILPDSTTIVSTNGIDECVMLSGSRAAINGNVTTASLYGTAAVTFNNNVGTLQAIGEEDINVVATVAGTVDHVVAKDNDGIRYEYYSVGKGKLYIEDGSTQTDSNYYSTTPPAQAVQPAQAAQPTQSQAATPAPSSSEYDDVPKTGESTTVYWLLGIAAACLAGRYALRKTF